MNLPDEERATRIDLQKRIQAAVLGKGTWDGVPEPLKKQANTAWFQSFLGFTPATVMPKVKQPLLILQGDIDRQVPVHHADRLAELARARKKVTAEAVQVVKLDWGQPLACGCQDRRPRRVSVSGGQGPGSARRAGHHRLACARDATETLRDRHRDTEGTRIRG